MKTRIESNTNGSRYFFPPCILPEFFLLFPLPIVIYSPPRERKWFYLAVFYVYRALIFGLTTKCRDEGQDKDTLKTKQIPTDKLFPLDRGCCFAAADAVITHLMRQEKCVTLRLPIDCVGPLPTIYAGERK